MKHELIYKIGVRGGVIGATCSKCGLVWNSSSGARDADSWKAWCAGKPAYDGWAAVPDNLLTVTQLKRIGLKPLGDFSWDAVCYTMNRKRVWYLFDKNKAVSIKAAKSDMQVVLLHRES